MLLLLGEELWLIYMKEVVKVKDVGSLHASIANKVLNSCYELSVVEKRIIMLVLARMDSSREVDSREWYSMDVAEYAKVCNVGRKDAYNTLKEGYGRLRTREIKLVGITSPKSERIFPWVQGVEIEPETHSIRLQWSQGIIPFISLLQSDFTRLFMEETMQIESSYTSRLYDFIYQNKFKANKGTIKTTTTEIITRWNVPESYHPYKYLKSKILLHGIKELKKRRLVFVELIEVEKRNVHALIFKYQFFCEKDWISIEENMNFKLSF